jgi:phosphate-selective porin OprO and OprP
MKTFKKIALAAAMLTIFVTTAQADEHTDLLDLLLQKGIITQQEHAVKLEAYKDILENKQFNAARIDKDLRDNNNLRVSKDKDGSVLENGIGIKSKDGSTTAQFTGRLHMDYRQFTPDYGSGQTTDSYQNLAEVRRARFGIKGQFNKDFKYQLLANFGASNGFSSTSSTADEMWVNYAAVPEMQFQFGLFKMPFSLEQMTSSNNIDFMERSLVGQNDSELIPAKETGFMLHGVPRKGLTYAVAASRGKSNKSSEIDGMDYIGRVTTNFAELAGSKDYVAHLGYAYSVGDIKSGITPASARTESRTNSGWFTGPALSGATTRTRQGIEAAVAYQGLKVQGEQFNFKYDPATGDTQEIRGHYVQALYNLTGENHAYKNGAFGWIKPKSAVGKGGIGAWQVGVRMSEFDASDVSVATGKSNRATAMTYGITWFCTDNLRFMLNYVDTKFDALVGSSGSRVTGDKAIMFRSQLSF